MAKPNAGYNRLYSSRNYYIVEIMQQKTQLGFASLQVSDLEVSRQFYTDVLRFEPARQSPPDVHVFADLNGAIFAIRKPLVDLRATDRLGWGVGLWFSVTDLDAFQKQVENKARVVRGVQQTPFGKTLVLADPDGYWLTFQEAPKA